MRRMTLVMVALYVAGMAALAFHLTQPVGAVPPSADRVWVEPAHLERDVIKLSSHFGPRDLKHPENLQAVAQFIAEEFRALHVTVHEQPFELEGQTFLNVIAHFGPETPERIVVGAHYDARGPHPGADDNASGVAGLLALGRLLAARPPPMRVELAAYTLEEYGLHGSAHHARRLADERALIRAMFSLEMIGYFSDEPNSQKLPSALLKPLYPSRGNFIAVIGPFNQGGLVRRIKKAMLASSDGLAVRSINAPRLVPGVDFSDHASFWNLDFPAVMVTDTAFYRNPRYHQPTDTPDTLDYPRMSKVVSGVYGAVLALAQPTR